VLQTRTINHVTWITFDRVHRLNSFTGDDYRDLRLAIDDASADAATHVIVLTGAGRAFSSGADRSLLVATADRAFAADEFAALLATLSGCEKPLLAAVNGLAVGFGCTMLLYCDLVVAAESARFQLPFTALGIIPEAGSTYLLPARARWDHVTWSLFSGEWFDADQARDLAIVWRVVDDRLLVQEAAQAAETIAGQPPASVQATKRLLIAGRGALIRDAVNRELSELRGSVFS
jgi:enoyl-CoA hydratase/carnithine racemase